MNFSFQGYSLYRLSLPVGFFRIGLCFLLPFCDRYWTIRKVFWSITFNSCSSILPLLNGLDTLVSNAAIADVTMSVNFMTSKSFFWYFLVSAVVTPLRLAPARGIAPNGILKGRPMNVLNVATLDIPEAMLSLLEQAFSHVSRSNILVYFVYFSLYLSSSFNNSCHLFWIMLKW